MNGWWPSLEIATSNPPAIAIVLEDWVHLDGKMLWEYGDLTQKIYLPYTYYVIDGDGCAIPSSTWLLSNHQSSSGTKSGPQLVNKSFLRKLVGFERLKPPVYWYSIAFNKKVKQKSKVKKPTYKGNTIIFMFGLGLFYLWTYLKLIDCYLNAKH